MGEAQGELKGLRFNAAVRVAARDERLTDVAGAVLVRESQERLGIREFLRQRLVDRRDPSAVRYRMDELVLSRIGLIAAGCGDQDDADVMRHDPAVRLSASARAGQAPLRKDARGSSRTLASQPTMSRNLAMLGDPRNREVMHEAVFEQAARRMLREKRGTRHKRLTIDADGFPIETAGHQSGSAYNGYYRQTMFHPLVAIAGETGDLLGVMLREGNAHAAEDLVPFLERLVRGTVGRVCESALVRLDAGMVSEATLAALERMDTDFIARVRNNRKLDEVAQGYLKRPPGRPPTEPRTWVHEVDHQPEAWTKKRRLVLVVQERPDELLPHHFWLVTSLHHDAHDGFAVLECYRQRGRAEAHIGEFSDVLAPRLSSSARGRFTTVDTDFIGPVRAEDWPDFAANEATLLLHALAYNAMHALRTLLPTQDSGESWSLRRLRERVVNVAGRVLLHARRVELVVTDAAHHFWRQLWRRLPRLDPLVAA